MAGRVLCGAVITAVLCAGAASPGFAAGTPVATLRSASDSARWTGSLANQVTPDPSFCTTASCPSWTVSLHVPRRSWVHNGGGLLVALHWDLAHFDAGYDLDLYVFGPDGRLAGTSASFAFSSDEAAWIQDPGNGPYRIMVVPRALAGSLPYTIAVDFQRGYTVGESATLQLRDPRSAEGSHIVMPGRAPASDRRRLPDLVPHPLSGFHLESAVGGHFYVTPDRGLDHQPSCYAQETAGLDAEDPRGGPTGALRCLRFDRAIENRGRGPFELRSYASDASGGAVYQTVYSAYGDYTERRVPDAVYYPHHGRMRMPAFDVIALHSVGADGRPGPVVARGPDAGTCKGDTQNARFGRTGDGPPGYPTPGSCDTYDWRDSSSSVHPGDTYVRLGISPSWLDTAPWYLPDDYVDVTRVPDGRYLLTETINANGGVLESRADNDMSIACVDLTATSATTCPLRSRVSR